MHGASLHVWHVTHACAGPGGEAPGAGTGLLQLPLEILELVGCHMDARSLICLANCCRGLRTHFRSRSQLSGLSVLEECARESVLNICKRSSEVAERWRCVCPLCHVLSAHA